MSKKLIAVIGRGPHEVKVHRDSELGEFTARLNGDPKSDYFTDDRDDAIATADAMLVWVAQHEPVSVDTQRRAAFLY